MRGRGIGVLQLQETVNVGEVEFDAMLVFINRPGHGGEADTGSVGFDGSDREEFGDEVGVQREGVIRKRGIVRGQLRKSQS